MEEYLIFFFFNLTLEETSSPVGLLLLILAARI